MSRDNYPGAYTLTRNAFPSPATPLNDFQRYSYNSSMQPGFGGHLDQVGSMYPYVPQHRSGQIHPDAPPFNECESFHHITVNSQKVTPSIEAKIHKGFFQADDKWTCYRRNYFSVTCSFGLQPFMPNATYFLQTTQGQHMEPISSFAMSISAVVNASENETRELVQHTPKRDKKSERKPEKVVLRPQQPYYLGSNIAAPGQHTPIYGMAQQIDYPYSLPPQPPTQHTFERIQFQKATANNGKRRAQQQYYNLVVELHAKVNRQDGPQWVKVAKKISDPMVVRGRSPGHYKDGRRDSSTSMGGDSGRGNPGDTNRGILPPSIDHQQYHQHVQFLYDSPRGDPQYSNSRDMSRHHHHQPQFGQMDHSADISPLVSASDASLSELMLPDTFGGHDSTDGSLSHYSSRYHDNDDNSSLRRDSGSTGSSNQSHVPSLDLSSNTESQDDAHSHHHMHHHHHHHTLDDTYDPMIASYHSEQEDGSQYLKHSPSERLPLTSIVNDSSQCSRPGGGAVSFPRFDPIQAGTCA
jgi:meiosis-specific transcription factor NDT80